MDRYIGLDVHTQSCTMAVVGPSGKRLRREVLETNGQVLISAVRSVPGRRHLCIEEGTQSAWLHELLGPHVDELVVTQPLKSKGSKSDEQDAWNLADRLRRGELESVIFKAPSVFAGLRSAVRGYLFVTNDKVRSMNRLNVLYRSRGVSVTHEIYEPERRGDFLAKLPEHHRRLAELLSEELDGLTALHEKAHEWLIEESKKHSIIKKLGTAPGMGPIGCAKLVAIGVTPHRFRRIRQFWNYCGLGVVTRTSADWIKKGDRWVRSKVNQTRGLNKNRQPVLKAVFKTAATAVIVTMREHPLRKKYDEALRAGTHPNLAKLTLARSIAAIVLAMWKHKEAYDPNRQERRKRTL